MTDCNICAEKYNKTKRAKIICSCGFELCRSCAKEYIMDKITNNLEDAHCMVCKIQWTRKFMSDNFEKTFLNYQYKVNYENLLLEKELNLLQLTQPYVEKEIKIEELKNKLNELEAESKEIEQLLLEKRKNNMLKKQQLKISLMEEINTFNSFQKKVFIRKCPNNECHGFLDENYVCDLCNNITCEHCHEILNQNSIETHVCNKDILESIKLLEKDSKPCPKCSSMIYKINGCDQIFCVECHTAWNWKTGNLITNNIHNPHYTEYMTQLNKGITPRNPLDVLCGREIDNHFVIMLIDLVKQSDTPYEGYICEVARNIMYMRYGDIPRFQDEYYDQYCRQLRINYMRNKINKDELKVLLQKKYKEYQKKKELFDIIITFINSITDIFYILVDEKNYDQSINEMDILRNHTNESLLEVSRAYGCKFYYINEEFALV